MKPKKKYEVQIAGVWYRTSKAMVMANGWLEYELRDGTVGLKRPGTWREIKPKASVKV